MKHTPGPWALRKRQSHGTEVVGKFDVSVAWCAVASISGNGFSHHIDSDEAFHNAMLIASAPNLLQALKQMLDAFYHDPLSGSQDAAAEAALDAIAKAEGEK